MRAIPQKKRPGVELNTNNVIKLKRKRIKKINPLWIIAGLLAAILIAVLVILVRGGAEGIAETGSVTVDVDYNAVIVRKEKVITSEAFDLADYFAEEGAWVEPDTKIMQIYRRGYSEEQAAALMRKHAEIYDEQLALLGETRDKTIRGYNESIALIEENIAEELMAGNSAEVRRQEAELLDALASRTDYLRENLQETETLRAGGCACGGCGDPATRALFAGIRVCKFLFRRLRKRAQCGQALDFDKRPCFIRHKGQGRCGMDNGFGHIGIQACRRR